jgi:Na+-driven multidrug efflux pump
LLFSKQIFLAIGQDEEIADKAAIFVITMIPGIVFYAWSTAYQRFCTNQREVKYPMWSNIGATVVHLGLCYFFVDYLGMDLAGVGIASSIQFAIR